MPITVLNVLDSVDRIRDLPGAELVERTTATRAWLTAVRSGQRRSVRRRLLPLYAVYTIGTVVAALTVIAMTVLGIAVIVAHGSVIDEKATSSEDWVFTVVFAVLSVILVPTAVCRVRRLRHARARSPTDLEPRSRP